MFRVPQGIGFSRVDSRGWPASWSVCARTLRVTTVARGSRKKTGGPRSVQGHRLSARSSTGGGDSGRCGVSVHRFVNSCRRVAGDVHLKRYVARKRIEERIKPRKCWRTKRVRTWSSWGREALANSWPSGKCWRIGRRSSTSSSKIPSRRSRTRCARNSGSPWLDPSTSSTLWPGSRTCAAPRNQPSSSNS